MTDEELREKYCGAYKYLNGKGIYDLRCLARALGVAKPTALPKKEIIMGILKAASGEERSSRKSARGARPKARAATVEEMDELMCYFQDTAQRGAELKLTAAELTALAELVYMGNYVVDVGKKQGQGGEKYSEVSHKIFQNFYAVRNRIADMAYMGEYEAADARDILDGRTQIYIAQFEKCAFRKKLSEIFEKIENFLSDK